MPAAYFCSPYADKKAIDKSGYLGIIKVVCTAVSVLAYSVFRTIYSQTR